MKRKCLAVFMGVMITAGIMNVLRVSANTLNPTIASISFSAYSKIDAASGWAGTASGSQNLYVTVYSTYSYVHPDTLDTGIMGNSNQGSMAATVSFSAPAGYRSVKISSDHTASADSERWSGSTSATY